MASIDGRDVPVGRAEQHGRAALQADEHRAAVRPGRARRGRPCGSAAAAGTGSRRPSRRSRRGSRPGTGAPAASRISTCTRRSTTTCPSPSRRRRDRPGLAQPVQVDDRARPSAPRTSRARPPAGAVAPLTTATGCRSRSSVEQAQQREGGRAEHLRVEVGEEPVAVAGVASRVRLSRAISGAGAPSARRNAVIAEAYVNAVRWSTTLASPSRPGSGSHTAPAAATSCCSSTRSAATLRRVQRDPQRGAGAARARSLEHAVQRHVDRHVGRERRRRGAAG